MEDFIWVTVKAQGNFLSLVCIVTNRFTHGVEPGEWYTTHKHLILWVTCGGNVLTKDSIFLLDFHEFLGFPSLGEYPNVYEDQYNECDHLLYTKINLLYSSEIGFPVRPSHNSNVNPISSKCVTRRSRYAMGSVLGPSA